MRLRLVALVAASLASRAATRPFSVDDLLRVERYAQVIVDPSQRWLVVERRGAAGSAPRFDLETHKALTLGQLFIVDLAHPAPPRPLLTGPDGYVALAFSPGGSALAVARLRGRMWELGVVTPASGAVRWLGLTPGLATAGRAVEWLSETTLAAIVHAPGDLPVYLRAGWQTKADLPALWEAAATGRAVTVTLAGSGRFREVTPRPVARRLMLVDVATGARHMLAEGQISDFEASPDGQRIAILGEAEDLPPDPARPLGVATPTRRQRLALVDVTGGRRTVDGLDVAGSLLSWSPDGRALLVFARRDGQAWSEGRMVRIDRRGRVAGLGGAAQFVVDGPPDFPPVAYGGWMGATPIALIASSGDPARVDWAALGRDGARPLTRGLAHVARQLVALDPTGLTARDGDDVVTIDRAGRIVGRDGPRQTWSSPAADAGGRGMINDRPKAIDVAVIDVAVTAAAGTVTTVRFAATGPRVGFGGPATLRAIAPLRGIAVAEVDDARGVGRLELSRAEGRALVLDEINRHLADVDGARAVAVHHASAKGAALTSWLFLPPDPCRGCRYPLVVIPYPDAVFGDTPPCDTAPNQPLDSISVQALAGRGFAVLLPSLPRPAAGGPAQGLAAEVLAVVDRVTARDDVDPARVALWGHSFGGYAAATIAAQSSRFRSVIASAGLFDLASAYGVFLPSRRLHVEDGLSVTTMAGWSETGQPHLGVPPWIDPQRYTGNSPVFAAARIDAPMLLLHGDQDIASLTQAEEMFSALYRQNKDAVLATYWGEGHVVASPANLRDLYARVVAWLDATMPAGTAPCC